MFAKKVDLTNLRSDIDRVDIDKLETAPTDLIKVSYVVENDVKFAKMNEFVNKFSAIQTVDTSDLVKIT